MFSLKSYGMETVSVKVARDILDVNKLECELKLRMPKE